MINKICSIHFSGIYVKNGKLSIRLVTLMCCLMFRVVVLLGHMKLFVVYYTRVPFSTGQIWSLVCNCKHFYSWDVFTTRNLVKSVSL